MSIDQEYKNFSKWCRDNPAYDLDPRLHTHSGRINDGGYISHRQTGTAFKAWQASRQALECEAVDVERIANTVRDNLGDIFACTRVWDAWQVGTMTQDDFTPADETDLADEIAESVAALYTHPASRQAVSVPDNEYIRALQDAFDIIQADANTEENYDSLCRIGSVLARLKSNQEQNDE